MPFYKTGAGNKGHVVEINDSKSKFKSRLDHHDKTTCRTRYRWSGSESHTFLALGTGMVFKVSACALKTRGNDMTRLIHGERMKGN